LKFDNPEDISIGDGYDKLKVQIDTQKFQKLFIVFDGGKRIEFDNSKKSPKSSLVKNIPL